MFTRQFEFKETGEIIVGQGETKEEAKADLKAKLKEYEIDYPPGVYRPGMRKYAPKMIPTGEYVNSPGFQMVQLQNGKVAYVYNENRKAQVRASPALVSLMGRIKRVGSEVENTEQEPSNTTEE